MLRLIDNSFSHAVSITAIVNHLVTSQHPEPNAFGAQLPVVTCLNIRKWAMYLHNYHDKVVVDFLRYGWPINYCGATMPISTTVNHQSALRFTQHIQHFIDTELSYNSLAGPFNYNPLQQELICSPLQTVPKRGSTKRRVVMDLSFPHGVSVNSGIPTGCYLKDNFQLRLPGIDRLCEFIRNKGKGCSIFKLDLQRAYRQLPVDPKDYRFLGFSFDDKLYFDIRCPFGLRSSALICQRTTQAVVYIFAQEGFLADVYLDDFYGAELPEFAEVAFLRLKQLLDELGLVSSPEKDSPPSTQMLCLGIQVDTELQTLTVPDFRIQELTDELKEWQTKSSYTKKQLQSLLGKLSFVTACVKPGRVFMSRLLNTLRDNSTKYRINLKVNDEMRADINWWLTFLPSFNGVSLIKPSCWDFQDLLFTTDACLEGGGATCLDECISFIFPPHISTDAVHISALEFTAVVVAVRYWSPVLAGRKFIISCDNEAVVTVVNTGKTQDHYMQKCLRQLWLLAATFDFEVRLQHISGIHNTLADCLSRWHKNSTFKEQFHIAAARAGIQYKHCHVPHDIFYFDYV